MGEFVPMRMAFIKFRTEAGELDYTDYKNEFIELLKQNWRLNREMDKSWLMDEDTAKAATIPEEAKKGFAWWVFLILAAITGVSAEEYYRRRKEKVREQSEKKDN